MNNRCAENGNWQTALCCAALIVLAATGTALANGAAEDAGFVGSHPQAVATPARRPVVLAMSDTQDTSISQVQRHADDTAGAAGEKVEPTASDSSFEKHAPVWGYYFSPDDEAAEASSGASAEQSAKPAKSTQAVSQPNVVAQADPEPTRAPAPAAVHMGSSLRHGMRSAVRRSAPRPSDSSASVESAPAAVPAPKAAVTAAAEPAPAPKTKAAVVAMADGTKTASKTAPVPAPKPAPVVATPKPAPVAAAPKPVQVAANVSSNNTERVRGTASTPPPTRVAQAPAEMRKPEAFAGTTTDAFGGVTENPPSRRAAEAAKKQANSNIMRVLTGKSLIIDLKSDAKRVSVANPEVAEVMIISPRQVMVNGLSEGETSIIIWDRKGNYTMYTLVSGETLQDQVMLEVTVAEINRTAMERHGVDVRALNGQFGVVTQYGNTAALSGQNPPKEGDPLFPMLLDGGISYAIIDTKNNIAALFTQLQDENLGRILAEPKLLTRSGKEANFLSGGEIPIVITQNQDTSIEFKEFGTKIEFIPRVREDGKIDLEVSSEVSEPDFAGGVELFGFQVPAFVTRRVDTDVSLDDGQSLIIAGLIKETKQEIESKMPFVGDIPFLGYFFRSTEYQNDVLELVMVVRPRLVEAIERGQRVALPTDRGPLTREEVRTKPASEKVTRPRPW